MDNIYDFENKNSVLVDRMYIIMAIFVTCNRGQNMVASVRRCLFYVQPCVCQELCVGLFESLYVCVCVCLRESGRGKINVSERKKEREKLRMLPE